MNLTLNLSLWIAAGLLAIVLLLSMAWGALRPRVLHRLTQRCAWLPCPGAARPTAGPCSHDLFVRTKRTDE